MLEIVLLVLAVLLATVVTVALIGLVRALVVTRSSRRRLRELGGEREVAMLLGRASDGRHQQASVGNLVRTDDALVFVPVTRGREVHVLREDVTTASATTTFMGRQFAEPVLLVTWEEHGTGDAVVVRVGDPDGWVEELSQPR